MSEGERGSDDKDVLARMIARRYVELWQDQVSALFSDPQGMAQVGRFLAAGMTPSAEQVWTMWRDFANLQANSGAMGQQWHDQHRPGNGAEAPPSGAAPAAAPPAGRDERLDELLARLKALEERVAALEPGTGAESSSAGTGKRGTPRRRVPRRT